jgi:hypothetical protein
MPTYNYGAAPTYVKLASYTVPSAVASYTFSNVPQGYTDLILVSNLGGSVSGEAVACRVNSDSGSNYSFTAMRGSGTAATSERFSSQTLARISVGVGVSTNASEVIITTQFNNYSKTTINKSFISRANKAPAGDTGAEASVALWRNTSAINAITVLLTGGNLVSGSNFTLYGIKAAFVPKATGGDIVVQDGTYWYHAFRTTGGFTPRQAITCDVVTIAGGGSGGWPYSPGGGAGGLLYSTSQSMSAETTYVCSVGAGGAGFYGGGGANGANSTVSASGFTTLTAVGGGGANASGGSGGGGLDADSGTRSAPAGTAGQGNAGGLGGTAGGNVSGGGGGGAGGAGGAASGTGTAAGAGGVGSSSYSSWGIATGTGHNVSGTIFYAGGGGGGTNAASSVAGAGGNGGGGRGASNDFLRESEAGMANTGGGSGGGAAGAAQFSPKSGGSGLIIVRYPI